MAFKKTDRVSSKSRARARAHEICPLCIRENTESGSPIHFHEELNRSISENGGEWIQLFSSSENEARASRALERGQQRADLQNTRVCFRLSPCSNTNTPAFLSPPSYGYRCPTPSLGFIVCRILRVNVGLGGVSTYYNYFTSDPLIGLSACVCISFIVDGDFQ